MAGIVERFNKGIVNRTETGCWEVKPHRRGYGRFVLFGETKQYHRVSFELFVDPIPSGMMVCHECDNPCCVNPAHLFLGTAQDNMTDKVRKGRHKGARTGSKHHSAKLVERQVAEIKELLRQGTKQQEIAEMYGVSKTIISNINTGKRWKHV